MWGPLFGDRWGANAAEQSRQTSVSFYVPLNSICSYGQTLVPASHNQNPLGCRSISDPKPPQYTCKILWTKPYISLNTNFLTNSFPSYKFSPNYIIHIKLLSTVICLFNDSHFYTFSHSQSQ